LNFANMGIGEGADGGWMTVEEEKGVWRLAWVWVWVWDMANGYPKYHGKDETTKADAPTKKQCSFSEARYPHIERGEVSYRALDWAGNVSHVHSTITIGKRPNELQ